MSSPTKPTPTQEPKRSAAGNQFLFAYGSLTQGLPAGPRNALLPGFERRHKGYASCVETPGTGDLLYGRLVEVDDSLLARIDTYAERTDDYHRFLTTVQLINGQTIDGVWVFQLTEHATPATLATSANGGFRELVAA